MHKFQLDQRVLCLAGSPGNMPAPRKRQGEVGRVVAVGVLGSKYYYAVRFDDHEIVTDIDEPCLEAFNV